MFSESRRVARDESLRGSLRSVHGGSPKALSEQETPGLIDVEKVRRAQC